jgi:hypothetical protein
MLVFTIQAVEHMKRLGRICRSIRNLGFVQSLSVFPTRMAIAAMQAVVCSLADCDFGVGNCVQAVSLQDGPRRCASQGMHAR